MIVLPLAATAAPARAAPQPRLAALALLRELRALWWWGVRRHVAELNGLPREAVDAPPRLRWPFAHL
ncbi:MAG TPA: hypothetical protein VLI41_16515 [Phenylobacterium sp.]|uniref:hypothetical protein n=1 Tax=Phenylobacterium sp. TaxID=1871053 RepID=UPI002CEAF2A3|nr:hypothetical protein [Phenylobacterium sp.]HSV04801.1 hypothetical protein [Phenylobacterium sp.]